MLGKQWAEIRTLSYWTKKEFLQCRNCRKGSLPSYQQLTTFQDFSFERTSLCEQYQRNPKLDPQPRAQHSVSIPVQHSSPSSLPSLEQSHPTRNPHHPFLRRDAPTPHSQHHMHLALLQIRARSSVEMRRVLFPITVSPPYHPTLPRLISGLCSLFGWPTSCSAVSTDFRRAAVFSPLQGREPSQHHKHDPQNGFTWLKMSQNITSSGQYHPFVPHGYPGGHGVNLSGAWSGFK